jgi:hypothetical protein
MRKYNTKLREALWYPFPLDEEIELQLRMFPNSEAMMIEGASENAIASGVWKVFDYCVVDWKGILDEEDNAIPCNEENKLFIFEQDEELMGWVLDTVSNLKVTLIEKKNPT